MPSASLYDQCLTAVAADLQALGLQGIPPAQVYLRKLPFSAAGVFADVQAPACVVCLPPAGSESFGPGTNAQADLGVPVCLAFGDRDAQDQASNRDRDLYWRQQVFLRYRAGRLAAVPLVFRCDVEPGPVIDPTLWTNSSWWISTLVLRFFARLAQG